MVFFDINGETYLSLTTCGMNMTPSIEYAYFMYSNLQVSKTYYKERLFKQPSYFEYVAGKEEMLKMCKALGITQRKVELAERRCKERLKEFSDSLNHIGELRDNGKLSQNEARLLGLVQFFKTEAQKTEEVKAMATN